MPEDPLSALLRLKRFEQPPAGYFDRLLQDLHRNQRAELLRRPLWRIAADRLQVFFGEHSMSPVRYAGAMAGLLVVGVAAIGFLTPIERGAEPGLTAQTTPVPAAVLSLQNSGPLPALETRSITTVAQPASRPSIYPPRYVIDTRPVSYEPSPSFSF